MKKSIFGILILMEGLFLTLALCVSLIYGEDDWFSFLVTASVSFLIGGICKWFGQHRSSQERLSRSGSFLVVALSWVVFSLIGMIPFIMYMKLDIASAFFETIS